MIRSEDARRTAVVYVDVRGRDLGGYVAEARERVGRELTLPPGYSISFAGQFEFFEKTIPRLLGASALALAAIVVLLYASSQSWFRVGLVLLAVPFSLVGAAWFLYSLDYSLSLAVVIGTIALAGLDAETGMVMLMYLDQSTERAAREGRLRTRADLFTAIHEGAVKRIRPKAMTVCAAFVGLVPIFWAEGSGSDVMRRLAAPLVGGLAISFVLELIVFPVVYLMWRRREFPAEHA